MCYQRSQCVITALNAGVLRHSQDADGLFVAASVNSDCATLHLHRSAQDLSYVMRRTQKLGEHKGVLFRVLIFFDYPSEFPHPKWDTYDHTTA